MGEPHYFVAYSRVLQWVGEVACRRKWEWPRREALEIKASPLVHALWREADVDLTMASVKLCPTLEAWDQMVWPTMATIPHTLTETKSYGCCQGQAVDLGPMMPVAQFWVTEEGGAYLCTMRALVFKGSILTYNPTLNEAEWVPACSLASNLSWAEERSAVALANYVPHAPAEAAQIARLGAGRIVSCPGDDSPTSAEEEEVWHSDTQRTNLPTDMDWEAEDESEDGAGGQTSPGGEAERDRWWQPWNWEAVMEEAEGLAYDDPQSDSDATVTGVDGS